MISSTSFPVWMDQLGWVLVHFLWEGAAIGLFTWSTLLVLRNSSAQIRYALLCAALVACGISPCLTWAVLDKETQIEVNLANDSGHESVTLPTAELPSAKTASVRSPISFSAGVLSPSSVWNLERLSGAIQSALPYFVTLWSLGVSVLSLRLVYGWIQLRRYCTSGVPMKDQVWTERLTALANRMGLRLTIILLESALVEVPTVIGWLRPVILVPATFFTGLPPNQIEAILAHELAHIRRYDYLVNLVQIAIETVLFYHPVVFWISRAIRQEREHCCDDLALQIVGNKATYASALAALEESRSLPMAITVAATGGSLLLRIKRLLGTKPQNGLRFSLPTLMGGMLTLCVAGLVIGTAISGLSPQTHLEFFASGQPVTMSDAAQQQAIKQIEEYVRSANFTSDENPEWFQHQSDLRTPKIIRDSGSYLHVIYSREKLLPTLAQPRTAAPSGTSAVLHAKEIYIGISKSGNAGDLPGSPGGICIITPDHREAYCTMASGILAIGLGLNPDIYPHLPTTMQVAVGRSREEYEYWTGPRFAQNEAARQAVIRGDAATLQKLITEGVDVKSIHQPRPTLLFEAGGPEVAELLIANGVDVKAKDHDGSTALDADCHSIFHDRNLSAPIARVLLLHGADPNAMTAGNWPPLLYALNGATVDVLVEFGADVHAKGLFQNICDFENPQRDATYYQALVRHGLSFDNKTEGLYLLIRACEVDARQDMIKWLLDRGVDPNGVSPGWGNPPVDQTPLRAATLADNAEAASLLLERGALIHDLMLVALDNQRIRVAKVFWEMGNRSISELLYAVDQRKPLLEIEKIVAQGVPADPPQDEHITPLALAAEFGEADVVNFLLKSGADVNWGNPARQPLTLAAAAGEESIVDTLLAKGAKPMFEAVQRAIDEGCYQRRMGLHDQETYYRIICKLLQSDLPKQLSEPQIADLFAVPKGAGDWHDLSVARILLDAGLSPKSKDSDGKTVIALVREEYETTKDLDLKEINLKLLLDMLEAADKGSAPKTTGPAPDMQYQMIDAARKGDAVTLEKLFDQGVEYDGKARPNQPTLLFYAGSPEVAELLVHRGIDVNTRNDSGESALTTICYSYQHGAETARVLLKHGADPNAADHHGRTPLMAAWGGDSVDVLIEYGAKLDAKTKDGKSGWKAINLRSDGSYYEALLKHGLAFDPKKDGPDLLTQAAGWSQIKAVGWLLDHGVDPNKEGNSRGSNDPADMELPLSAAISDWANPYDHPEEVCKLLLEHGAKASEGDVMAVAASKNQQLEQLLKQYKALPVSELAYAVLDKKPASEIQEIAAKSAPSTTTNSKKIPFYLAIQTGDLATVKLFVQNGADLKAIPSADPSRPWLAVSPLSLAAMEGQDAIVDYLLKHGAKAQYGDIAFAMRPGQSSDSKTTEPYENTVKLLIAADALKNITEDQTALLFSSALGSMTPEKDAGIVKLLLEAGLNPNARTNFPGYQGKTAIDLFQMEVDREKKYHLQGNTQPLLDMLEAASKDKSAYSLIDSEGTYPVMERQEPIRIKFADNKLTIIRPKTGGGIVLSPCQEDWKIYADGTATLWVYDGTANIQWVKFDAGGIAVKGWSHDFPEMWTTAPKDFLRSIPNSPANPSSTAKPNAKMENTALTQKLIVRVQNSDGSALAGASAKAEGPNISTDVTTGTDGLAAISLPTARPQYLSVRVRKDGFVPKLITWSLDQPSFSLPSDFTLKMEKAQTIGGVVKNDDGQPVAGANVVLIIRGSSMGAMTQQVFNDIWERRVTTDKDGKWHFDEAPSDLRPLQVRLEHPDYVSDEEIYPRPGDDEFKNLTALLILHRGTSVDGSVTNESGKPIPGVDVTFGEAGSSSTTFPNTKTDASGHFHFGGLSVKRSFGNTPILTFTSANYAPEMAELTPLTGGQSVKIVLKSGKPLRLRFTDQQGHPIKDLILAADHWRGHRPFGCIRFQSDQDWPKCRYPTSNLKMFRSSQIQA